MRAVIQMRAICKIRSSSAPQNHQSQWGTITTEALNEL